MESPKPTTVKLFLAQKFSIMYPLIVADTESQMPMVKVCMHLQQANGAIVHSCQPAKPQKRDKLHEIVGFSVKKRDIAQIR